MGIGKELDIATRKRILKLYFNEKIEQIRISKILNIPQTTISDTITRYKRYGTVESLKRTGRPRKTNKKIDKLIKKLIRKRFCPIDIVVFLKNENIVDINIDTVKNRIKELFKNDKILKIDNLLKCKKGNLKV